MPELNDALEHATDVSDALAAQVQDALETIGDLMDGAKGLGPRIETVGEQAHEKLTEMATLLDQSEKELDGQAQAAKAAMDGLQAKAGELETQVGELLGKIHSGVQELEHAKEDILSKLNAEAEEKKNALAALADQIKELETEADGHLDEAEGLISKFKDTVDTARNSFSDAKEKLESDLDDFESKAKDTLDEAMTTLDQFMDTGANILSEFKDTLGSMGDEAINKVANQFMEEAVQHLLASCQPLEDAFDALKQICDANEDSVVGKITEIGDKVGEIAQILEPIKPVLEMIESML
jgi:chromosome segregation ATPase